MPVNVLSSGSILDGTPGLKPQQLQQPQQKPEEEKLRPFGDAPATRTAIYDNVLHAASNLRPLANKRHTLTLTGLKYIDPPDYSKDEQKQAILKNQTLGRRIQGQWTLYDNATQQPIESKRATVLTVPYMSDRGTFIHRGSEYTLSNQMRLRPGIFTRIKDNGEIESHVNVLPGDGASHRYFLDPDKGIFYMRLHQAKIPLMPLMHALGASDRQLEDAWGGHLFIANKQKDIPAAFNKLYTRLVRNANLEDDSATKAEKLRQVFDKMKLDPEVMKRTLGQPYDRVSLDSIIATTKKLLAVSRGEADVDDRDHLAYQTVLGPEDLLAERIAKDAGHAQRKLLFQSSFKGNLNPIKSNSLQRQLESALLHSGLGQALEEINPSELFDKQTKISRMGEGGIPSYDAIPDEARSVQPSHLAFIDPLRSPESFRVGVDLNLANAVRKGPGGRIYSPFKDVRTGKIVYHSPQDVAEKAIAFPGEMQRNTKRVTVMQGGRIRYLPKNQVDLELQHFENAFSPLGNMIPVKSAVKGQRAVMASRMYTQALPLKEPQSPFVQSAIPGKPDRSFEEEFAKYMGAIHTPKPGVVKSVDANKIQVRHDDGSIEHYEMYNNYPFNRKTLLHNTPVVNPGDRVNAGDLLARSNYTDPQGVSAIGANFRVAYLPFRGSNFEDAIGISSGAAKRLTSEHMYQHSIEFDERHRRGKRNFVGIFPSKFDRSTLDTMDDDGLIKPGTEIGYGHPLILAARQREITQTKIHRRRDPGYSDESMTWEHHTPGIVTDVMKTPKGATVLVKSYMPMQVGDKMSGRFGDKGVVAQIIPDEQMPKTADGKPIEILLNPLGIISRTNPGQKIESALGKIAERTGKPYKVSDFSDIPDLSAYADKELAKHGLTDLEDIYDAETGQKIPQVHIGNRFFMKLHHTAESKGQGRGLGSYTMTGEPAKGGETGSKRISLLDVNALLSHGVTSVLRDAASIRGQRNEEFWLPFMQGLTPPKPKIPLIYEKFINELKASGINVVPQGGQLHIMALTDPDVKHLAGNRYLQHGDTVRWDRGLEPVPGGLFDPGMTGGHEGNRWSAIKLHEPMPNPVMEEPIRRMLGLTQDKFLDVLSGKTPLNGETGPAAIHRELNRINIDKAIEEARATIASGRKTHRDAAVRKLSYLKSAKRLGIHPRDWMMNAVPVLPPKFRPVSVMTDSKLPLVSDANYLYRELIDANNNLSEMKKKVEDVGDERLALYHAFKAVTGLGDPVQPQLQEKNVRGILKHIFGSSPKFGTVQRRLISSTVDLVGRAVVAPNPNLDMDHIGLPENRAWEVYKNFIIRRLRRNGMPAVDAVRQVRDRSPLARQEMLTEMAHRPVYVNRAPILHRFGIMAFWPQLTKSDVLEVSPLVVKGFGMDFDGDTSQYHVPVEDDARQEAIERMLPSRNLLAPSDFKSPVHAPMNEYVGGLFAATNKPAEKRPRVFRNEADVIAALHRGDIGISDPVEILQ